MAERLKKLPPYLFAELDRMKEEAISRGVDIISLGIGDPDIPTPVAVVERLAEAARDEKNHQYPSYEGMLEFRKAVAGWYRRRFGVELDPETEVLTLIGSKEGIGHLPLALLDPGDTALIPDPAYPVYMAGTTFAGAIAERFRLEAKNHFLPRLDAIPRDVAQRAKLMFLNYPNNPTAATADEGFFEQVVRFAKESDIAVCHDAAYSEIAYDGYRPPSFLSADGAKDTGIEFHSLSKTFNMTGWRIGFAVGNSRILSALGRIKANLDSGVFQAVQQAAITALESQEEATVRSCEIFRERRDKLVEGLARIGWKVPSPRAAFYVWAPVPAGYDAMGLVRALLDRAGVIITPGTGFGPGGEGYVRMSLTVSTDRLEEALDRIARAGL